MRRPFICVERLLVAVLLIAGCAAQRGEDRLDPLGLVPPPPTITPAEAGRHVGELVAVRAKIGLARVSQGQAFLEPEDEPEGGLVIAIAPPVIGPSAQELADMYRGQEVRAVGTISDLGGDLELLIGDPGRIRLADVSPAVEEAAPAATPTREAAPTVTRTKEVAADATPAEEAALAVAAAAPPSPAGEPPTAGPDPACEAARRAWRQAANEARGPLRELLACLERGAPRCTPVAARARVALAEVAASEERVRWVCGAGS